MAHLRDLGFIDIYVRLDEASESYFRSSERGKGQISQQVPPTFLHEIDRLRKEATTAVGSRNQGVLDFDGIRLRLSRIKMSDGGTWICARQINRAVRDIDDLGIPPALCGHLKGLGWRDGLIVISGATGAGKTTTAASLLSHYLKKYGGTALTVEDPVEYLLKGRYGQGGQCFQMQVENDEDWADYLRQALRWVPRYIYVGEIRTPKAAEELLRAATTGHLVITTVHASSLEEALMGIVFLADQAMGTGGINMLSAALTAAVHQTMGRPMGVRYVFTEAGAPGDPVRALVREGKIAALGTYIDRAEAKLQAR